MLQIAMVCAVCTEMDCGQGNLSVYGLSKGPAYNTHAEQEEGEAGSGGMHFLLQKCIYSPLFSNMLA